MKFISYILLSSSLILGLSSCHKEGLEEFSNDISYLFFEQDITQNIESMTFKLYPSGTARISIVMKSIGKWRDQDITFRLEADPKLTNFPANHYKLPESFIFRKNRESDTCYVELYNSPELASRTDTLALKVVETESIKEGPANNRRFLIEITDRLIQPVWWKVLNGGYNGVYTYNIAEQYYLGAYSEKKYAMFIEELNKDGVVFDGSDLNVLRKYALRLKYRIEAYNNDPANAGAPMWDEENNEPMTIPVAG